MTVIERVDPLPGDDDPEHEENDPGYPAFPDLPERPQPLVSSSSVLDMVVWFEAMDTRQAWLRRWGLTQEADLIVTDMGAMARALECPMLEARITERLPKQADEAAPPKRKRRRRGRRGNRRRGRLEITDVIIR